MTTQIIIRPGEKLTDRKDLTLLQRKSFELVVEFDHLLLPPKRVLIGKGMPRPCYDRMCDSHFEVILASGGREIVLSSFVLSAIGELLRTCARTNWPMIAQKELKALDSETLKKMLVGV
ncbi:hypothetical protein H0W80_00680 [Candidatus Saccharibacteria bacterium]|nr:hypothetical protein [Candidatus Saccharibacteria bacterium]